MTGIERRIGLLVVFLMLLESCGDGSGLSRKDRKLRFGEKAFGLVVEVDREDPERVLISGILQIEDGELTATKPGAVLVVCVVEWKTDRTLFKKGDILLVNSKGETVLAPPGTVLTIPGDLVVLGREYEQGEFRVPKDSKFPDYGNFALAKLGEELQGHWKAERDWGAVNVAQEYFGAVSEETLEGPYAESTSAGTRTGTYVVVKGMHSKAQITIKRVLEGVGEQQETITLSPGTGTMVGEISLGGLASFETTYTYIDSTTAP